MTIEEINEHFGTSFRLGDAVRVDRAPKSPHIGIISGTEDCFLKLLRDGETVVYPAVYDPQDCEPI